MTSSLSATRVPIFCVVAIAIAGSASAFQTSLGLRAPGALRAGTACHARSAPAQGLRAVVGLFAKEDGAPTWKKDGKPNSQKGKIFIEQIIQYNARKANKKPAAAAEPEPVLDLASMPPILRKIEEEVLAAKTALAKAEAALMSTTDSVAALAYRVTKLDRERAIQAITVAKTEEKRRAAAAEVKAAAAEGNELVLAAKKNEMARFETKKAQEEAVLGEIVAKVAKAEAERLALKATVPRAEHDRTVAGENYFKAEAKAKIERRAAAKKMANMA